MKCIPKNKPTKNNQIPTNIPLGELGEAKKMNYTEIDCTLSLLTTSETNREILIAFLADIGCESFEESENGVKAYIPKDCYKEEQLNEVIERCAQLGFTCLYKITDWEQENWNALWESNYESVVVDEQCYIRAPFHPARSDMKYEIVIEPKMSFGTAHHETTSLMISYLLAEDCKDNVIRARNRE